MSLTQPDRRNVTFYDAASPNVALGGLVHNGSITEANFLDMLEFVLVVEEEEEGEKKKKKAPCVFKRGNRTISYPERTCLFKREPTISRTMVMVCTISLSFNRLPNC